MAYNTKKEVRNSASRYGMNALANYQNYLKNYNAELSPQLKKDLIDFSSKKPEEQVVIANKFAKETGETIPPLNFEVRYSPKKVLGIFGSKINKMALMGAAYQELGHKSSVSVENMANTIQSAYNLAGSKDKADTSVLDINHDGQIDIGEEAASIVLADILSKHTTNKADIRIKNANGTYTKNDENGILPFANVKNNDAARKIFEGIYSDLKLDKAQNKFLKKIDS